MTPLRNLSYVLRRLMDMNYRAMFQKINALHKKTGRSRLFLLRDMQRCAVKYGAGYMDYDLFEMYDLTDEQRDTYLTRGRNNALVRQYNDPAYIHFFDNKADFNTCFASYLHRSWIRLDAPREEVLAYIAGRPQIIAKPIDGTCGKGVEKISTTAESPEAIYDRLIASGTPLILEDVITQHPAVSSVYPEAINTVRAVTINKDGKVHLICTYFRIGNHGKNVDNFNSGGMVAPVDEVTGIVADRAIDKEKNLYVRHPYTGTDIQGFRFPDWEKMRQMVTTAALKVPQIGYLGWDVAFTPDGPCLVEGNNFPGHDIYQLPEHTPNKIGMMEKFRV